MQRVCCFHRDALMFTRALHGELSASRGSNGRIRYRNSLLLPLSHGSIIRRRSFKLEARLNNVQETELAHPEKQQHNHHRHHHHHHKQLKKVEQEEEEEGEEETAVIHGSIHLIIGPMFAGKTTALLKRVQAESNEGRRVAMVKSSKDTRYASTAIVSHDNMQMPCWSVPTLASFRSQIGEAAYSKLDVIGIDEAQFLTDLVSFCQFAADYEGKTLIIAGLDGDFLRNRFGSVLDLIPVADSVVKLSAHCELCGKPACFTFRKSDERQKELIGGSDTYMPVCRRHYFSGKIAMETAQTVLGAHKISAI